MGDAPTQEPNPAEESQDKESAGDKRAGEESGAHDSVSDEASGDAAADQSGATADQAGSVQSTDAQAPAEQSGDAAVDTAAPQEQKAAYRSLRIWPAIVLLVALWAIKLLLPLMDFTLPVLMTWFFGPIVCGGLIVIWWLTLSRATWKERLGGLVGLGAILVLTTVLADKSMKGMGTMRYAIPFGISGFAVAVILLARRKPSVRTGVALVAALGLFGIWDLMYAGPMSGNFDVTLSWRWVPTPEEKFLANLEARKSDESGKADANKFKGRELAEPDWPGFRGPNRDSVQPGVVLGQDWAAQPPRELWRVRIGPGWSSFVVAGKRLFTQEQRGLIEAVVCYDADTGQEIWSHKDKARFWESLGGAGPRATPTLTGGKLFCLGATGLLNRLDPLTGKQIWQSDINKEAGRKPPTWGYSSSPLVTDGLVIVHAGGAGDKGILAYDIETGKLRWGAPAGDHSYSSPHLAEILGQSVVLMISNTGLDMVDPADGGKLGEFAWPMQGFRVVQPLVVDDSSLLLGTQMGQGTKRIKLSLEGEGDRKRFKAQQTWLSRRMNPYFNDFVAHKGHLYGFDNNIFACIDLATGERKWKGGRYGNGQVLLLPDEDQLLVLSETGEIVLLRAGAEDHVELTRYRAFKGKTWNHPVLIGNRLYVRNSEEAACFEMPVVTAGAD